MKKQLKKILTKLADVFKDDEDAFQAIDLLVKKVSDLPDASTEESIDELPLPPEMLQGKYAWGVFSDGACRGNPGPGAWAAMGQDRAGAVLFEASGVDVPTTNNRMELEGAIRGLELLQEHWQKGEPIAVFSDSKYVVDGMEKWVPGWKKRGWKKADNKVPENCELWQKLEDLGQEMGPVRFFWVRGHAGHPQNEHCDRLANVALDEAGF